MKKQILLITFCFFSLISFSQTKDYYKDGNTINCKNRQYVFKNAAGPIYTLFEVGNEVYKYKSRTKIGNHEMNDPFDSHCNIEDNKLFYDIVNKILKKYGFEVYREEEIKPRNYKNRLTFYFDVETTNWKIIGLRFSFSILNEASLSKFPIEGRDELSRMIKDKTNITKASTIPIEAYDELNKMIKNKIRCKPNDMAEKFTYAKSAMRLELK